MRERFPARVYAVGFSHWKRSHLRRFLSGSEVIYSSRRSRVPDDATTVLWGVGERIAERGHGRRVMIEDGFLRSVGLGADLTSPLSWVWDDVGLYYDARSPSRLENILSECKFDDALIERAARLRDKIIATGITKYNTGGSGKLWRRPHQARFVILAVGQVEADASIKYGSPNVSTNIQFLAEVRSRYPSAYIVYKPHPDVVAGLRRSGRHEDTALDVADEVICEPSIIHLYDECDEVHTMTSLSGFEALLRGKRVVCYGVPFYAGWGLTKDFVSVPRRRRRLSIDELVAGCLILYPTYLSRKTACFTTPERAIDELVSWRSELVQRRAFPRVVERRLVSAGRAMYWQVREAVEYVVHIYCRIKCLLRRGLRAQ